MEVTLRFKWQELLYDIENYSFVEGDIMNVDDEHIRHHVLDVGQSGNIDRVKRVLNLAHAECVEMLFPYTKENVPEDVNILDNALTASQTYDIDLNLPDGFSLTTVKLLKNLIHEYLVSRVLSDWFSITKPSSHANWENKFQYLKSKIQRSLVSRTGNTKRKCKPF